MAPRQNKYTYAEGWRISASDAALAVGYWPKDRKRFTFKTWRVNDYLAIYKTIVGMAELDDQARQVLIDELLLLEEKMMRMAELDEQARRVLIGDLLLEKEMMGLSLQPSELPARPRRQDYAYDNEYGTAMEPFVRAQFQEESGHWVYTSLNRHYFQVVLPFSGGKFLLGGEFDGLAKINGELHIIEIKARGENGFKTQIQHTCRNPRSSKKCICDNETIVGYELIQVMVLMHVTGIHQCIHVQESEGKLKHFTIQYTDAKWADVEAKLKVFATELEKRSSRYPRK
ncbi:hypothetical protein BC828DRAFT_417281 [Blastocladiella britannica]|nr:hypothetical protein BC828DRAFT_417281 [Blastocladiella britannica]